MHSEETARLIDADVRRLVDEAGEFGRGVLTGSRDVLDRVAAALIERETLALNEVEETTRAPVVGSRLETGELGIHSTQLRC